MKLPAKRRLRNWWEAEKEWYRCVWYLLKGDDRLSRNAWRRYLRKVGTCRKQKPDV